MPTTSNNVVLYSGRFDVDNSDGELYPGMTTQVFFVTSSAHDVLTVPIGALTFTDTPRAGGAQMSSRSRETEGAPNREELIARGEMPEITPEMRQRFEQMRAQGGFDGSNNFPGGGGFRGRGNNAGSQQSSLSGSIPLNEEPRHATVQLVQDDGSRVTREVVVGAMDRVNAEVISGLEEGDRVVAGIVEARIERDESNDRGNSWRGMSRGMF
jgi:macrolide-specific efflux system membrane fusion protein